MSWVFLTGRYAYKIKKPVKLPFVDFSTLALRRRFCREELRVNRRLAPALYLAVVPIGGSRAAPRIGRKPAIEYAVKMREFPSAARLDRRLAAKRLPRAALAEFGARLARFHARSTARSRRRRRRDRRRGAAQHRRARGVPRPRQPEQARNAASLDAAARRAPRGACLRSARQPARTASATAICICRICSGATARSWRSTHWSSTASCATSTSSARSRSSRWICARTGAPISATSS